MDWGVIFQMLDFLWQAFKGNLFQNLMNNFHSFPSPNTSKIFNLGPKLEYTINEWRTEHQRRPEKVKRTIVC